MTPAASAQVRTSAEVDHRHNHDQRARRSENAFRKPIGLPEQGDRVLSPEFTSIYPPAIAVGRPPQRSAKRWTFTGRKPRQIPANGGTTSHKVPQACQSDEDVRLLAILQHILAPTVSYRVRLEAAVRHLPDLEIVPSAALEVLTPREKEVLVLAAQGLTSGAIGHRLGITERGVRKHLTAVYAKTGTHSRAAAAAWWSARQR